MKRKVRHLFTFLVHSPPRWALRVSHSSNTSELDDNLARNGDGLVIRLAGPCLIVCRSSSCFVPKHLVHVYYI